MTLGIVPLFGAHAYLGVQRELELFDSDMQRDLELVARVLRTSFVQAWEIEGAPAARSLIAEANGHVAGVGARWIPEGLPPGAHSLPGPPDSHVELWQEDDPDGRRLHVGIPVEVYGVSRGLIDVSEPMQAKYAYTRATVVQALVTTLAMIAASFLVAMTLGRRLFGARLEQLLDLTRAIGRGELRRRIQLTGGDELVVLGEHMNAMSEALEETRLRLVSSEAERVAALGALRHADRLVSIGRLASSLAHELGTPLNVILARAKIIATRGSDLESGKNADIIRRQAERMTEIMRTTLAFVRQERTPKSRINLTVCVQQALDLLQPIATGREVNVQLVAPVSALIFGHPTQISQVVTNLVTNALDALSKGGNVEISIRRVHVSRPRFGSEKDHHVLSIEDDGVGIPDEMLERLFEAFSTNKAPEQGTGLGLWIVDGIVRDHGGWIDVQSRLGVGTRFAVYLPAEPA